LVAAEDEEELAMAKSKPIIVDGSNIAYEGVPEGQKPKVSNLLAIRAALEKKHYDPIIIDATLRHDVDNPDELEHLIDDQEIRQAPAETEADYFVLATAERLHAQVISNDQFESYRDQFPWIGEQRVPLMMIDGTVQLYEPQLEAADEGSGEQRDH
jgi:hypothetical protein